MMEASHPLSLDSSQETGVPGAGHGQSILFSSIHVYAIAERYGIPDLKALAKERFRECSQTNWACVEFPSIIRVVFESTPSSDSGLRDIVPQLVVEHADEFIENADFLSLVEGNGQLWRTQKAVGTYRKSMIEALIGG
jgi:hypothetical protein